MINTHAKTIQIPIMFADAPDVFDALIVNKTLSESDGSSVYEVHSPQTNTSYALKVFSKDSSGMYHYQNERLMVGLEHPNVIHYVPIINRNQNFSALITEYAEFSFFDLVKAGLLNHEVLVRSYFHQLIDGLEYIHSKGIAHLDLKLENLMMGSDYLLKIIDFDQSQPIRDSDIRSGGTIGFRAPELKKKTAKDAVAVDIYAAGIVLYAFLTSELPFVDATHKVKRTPMNCYSYFVNYKEEFWRNKVERFGNKPLLNEAFIELMNGMLCIDPKKRFGIKQIKDSRWYNGFTLDQTSLMVAMISRCRGLKGGKKLP